MLKGGIGSTVTYQSPRLIQTLHRPATCLMIQERVVGNLEEPGTELPLLMIASRRDVSPHQRILSQVIRIILPATAEGKQEPSQSSLLTLHLCDEFFPGHGSRLS